MQSSKESKIDIETVSFRLVTDLQTGGINVSSNYKYQDILN